MPIHPPDALSTLPPEYHVGTLDPTTAPASAYEETEEEIRIRKAREALPHPEAALNLNEIEVRVGSRSNCSAECEIFNSRPTNDRNLRRACSLASPMLTTHQLETTSTVSSKATPAPSPLFIPPDLILFPSLPGKCVRLQALLVQATRVSSCFCAR